MQDKEFLNQIIPVIKRVPGAQSFNSIRLKIIRIRELSDLIKENKVIVFPNYSLAEDNAVTHAIAHEVVKEWLDLYGILYLRRTTAAVIGTKAPTTLLWIPISLLSIPPTHDEYIKGVEHATRRNIRLAERQGYEFREFVWNDYLDDIYEINTSKEIRQSEPMRGWYREPVQPRHPCEEELRYQKYCGAFKDGRLYAYFHFYICGDLAYSKHIIGHAEHLRLGIMSGLISYSVRECIGNSQIRWLEYGAWDRKGTLNAFKRRAGFQGYAILLNLEGEQELLKYSEQKVKTWWRI